VTAYLTLAEFKVRTVMPSEDVDLVEARYPGYVAERLTLWSAWLNGRLKKRYAAPFETPYPDMILKWLTDIATVDVYKKRGWNPSSEQDADILKDRDTALAEVKEACDSNEGLFELPLRQDLERGSGVSKGGPFGYAEASPYTWTDRQAEAARDG
jgi:hypothetical protein